MQTPRGVFEIKYFFSGGITGQDGEGVSSNSIKTMIKRNNRRRKSGETFQRSGYSRRSQRKGNRDIEAYSGQVQRRNEYLVFIEETEVLRSGQRLQSVWAGSAIAAEPEGFSGVC